MSWWITILCLLCKAIPVWADSYFDSGPCKTFFYVLGHSEARQAEWEAEWKKDMAAGRALETQRPEFFARTYRRAFLGFELAEKESQLKLLSRILVHYAATNDCPSSDHARWWRAVRQAIAEIHGEKDFTAALVPEFKGAVPLYVTLRRPPVNFAQETAWLALSNLAVELAQYRLAIYQELASLPLNVSPLIKAHERDHAKIVANVEARFRFRRSQLFVESGAAWLSGSHEEIPNLAREVIDSGVPDSMAAEIEGHLRFMTDFSLPATASFAEYVVLSRIYRRIRH